MNKKNDNNKVNEFEKSAEGQLGYHEPYWGSDTSALVIIKELKEIKNLLSRLIYHEKTIIPTLERYVYTNSKDVSNEEKCIIKGKYEYIQQIITDIISSADTTIFMCCVNSETRINMFCYYELGEETAEAVETLSLTKKLIVTHKVLNKLPFVGTHPYEALNSLVKWRNAYVHGKCNNMSVKALKKNHISTSEEYSNLIDKISELIEYLKCYLAIIDYLPKIATHECTKGVYSEEELIKKYIIEMEVAESSILNTLIKNRDYNVYYY